jgi:lipoyl-dependent peroxiredoxin
MPRRTADARWDGNIESGSGNMRLGGGAFEGQYSFQSRFEEGEGTNPEELIAAAHAGCFSMALTVALGRAGHDPQSVESTADVRLEKVGDGFGITRIDLRTRARVPGISDDEFQQLANAAKENCPVSKALGGVDSIGLEATLES